MSLGLRVPLPDPKNALPWAHQMKLDKLSDTTFRSTMGALSGGYATKNGKQRPRAFGGHVFAQSAYAASKRVDKGFIIHSITGYFTLLGLSDEPFTYEVQVVRNGRGYCVRSVTVRQQDDPTICFTCICSFKKTEPGLLDVQEKQDLQKKYASLLKGKTVEDFPVRSDMQDARFAALNNQEPCIVAFPGIYTTLLPFEELHKTLAPIDRKSLFIYTTINDEKSEQEHDPNLDACAHLYHSDRESIYSMIRQYELFDILGVASSLSHTVTLHVGADQLRFRDESGKKRWFWSETGAKRVADGRGLHEGRIYASDGVLIASAMQDGMLKLKEMSPEEVIKKGEWASGRVGSGSKL